jgi:hypothetical protein
VGDRLDRPDARAPALAWQLRRSGQKIVDTGELSPF